MKKNEYSSLEDFTLQYTGEWGPSDGHWLGLDFSYNGKEYRFHTGSMYRVNETLADGREIVFSIYRKKDMLEDYNCRYELLGEYGNMDEVLDSRVIENTAFKEIIVDKNTELLGQD